MSWAVDRSVRGALGINPGLSIVDTLVTLTVVIWEMKATAGRSGGVGRGKQSGK